MIFPVYAVRDVKSGFVSPYIDANDLVAKRNFKVRILQDPVLNSNPEDFFLYKIGEFDTESGVVTSSPAEQIDNALSYVEK